MMNKTLSVACLAIVTPAASAQAPNPTSEAGPSRTLVSWVAAARDQPLKTRVGPTNDRDLYVVGLRARWFTKRLAFMEAAYTFDVIPAVVSTGMPSYRTVVQSCASAACRALPTVQLLEMTPQTVYGAGVAPLGGELRVQTVPRLAVLLRGSAGVVYFSKPIPDPGEKRFNFVFDAGAAAEMRLARRLGVTAGSKINPISAAGR